jgi:ATP-dependent Clp protease ATP-binding subunit ClpA
MTTESVVPEVHHVWSIYLQASEEARRRGDRRTGTDHILLALLEDPSVEIALGVNLRQARQALESLDQEALGALGMGPGSDAPALPMRAVPRKPRIKDVATKDRFRMTPAAKKVLEQAVKPNRRKTQVTAHQVLAQILTLQPPDPAPALLGVLGLNTAEIRRRLDAVMPKAVPFNDQARG